MARAKFEAGTYEVVNTSRRTRVRDGQIYPGAADGRSTGEPVSVKVTGREQLHRLMACTDLKVTGPVKRAGNGGKGKQPAGGGDGGGKPAEGAGGGAPAGAAAGGGEGKAGG